MLKPTQFIKLVEKEIGTIIQLSKNIQPEMLNYRPKENMRTMEELMNYISGCGYNFQSYWMTDGSLVSRLLCQLESQSNDGDHR
ncbi:MAG: hypothetical protein IPK03_16440 [Bacteroidetes bacterium]|nr:hypothetical protein [Bacteroidota bacterium]